jgi:hypothetical protein
MPMVEIDEEQLALLRRADAFLGKALNDGDIGPALQRKAKADFPNARFAADVADPFIKPIHDELKAEKEARTKLQDRLDARDKSEKDAKETSELNASLESARKRYRLTDEGMDKVMKRMRDMNNPDAEAAAAWVTDNEPAPKTTPASSYSPQALNLFGAGEKSEDEKIQLLHRDPLKFFDREVADILAEGNQAA